LLEIEVRAPPIPNSEIDSVHALVSRRIRWTHYPFLKVGDRVRVHGGALDGIEGILLSESGDDTLVVSVQLLGRSLAVSVAGYQIEALPPVSSFS
jgi:transcription antitermination factor NusG